MNYVRDVQIERPLLRRCVRDAVDAIRTLESIRELDADQGVLLFAYVLGVVMHTAGVELKSLHDLELVVQQAYLDLGSGRGEEGKEKAVEE